MAGWVYAIRFDPPYRHATAYLGSTTDLHQRLQQHRSGAGSPLVKAAIASGCHCEVIALRTTKTRDARQLERKLKTWHNNRKAIELLELCGAITIK